jgi:glycerate kinase
MEAALERWTACLRRDLAVDVTSRPGIGAGGGMAAGVFAWHRDATIESGAELVAEAIGLAEQVAQADLVITGEGALDAQTAYGKAVAHVIAVARNAGTPCFAVAGSVLGTPAGVAAVESLADPDDATGVDAAMREAAARAEAATERLLRRVFH